MSYHCSLALAEDFSARGCLDGDQCAELKSIRIAERSCFDAKKKGSSRRSPSGTMYEPSMAGLGVARWMSSLGASRVSRSARQEKDSPNTMCATCGLTPSESYAKWDHATSCWKTYQRSLLTNTLEPLSGSFRRAGIACGGRLYRLPSLEHRIGEIGSGLWATPRTCSSMAAEVNEQRARHKGRPGNFPNLETQWPTPNVPSGGRVLPEDVIWKGSTAYSPITGRKMQVGLEHAAKNWPTPSKADGTGGPNARDSDGRPHLSSIAAKWPTPKARDHRTPGGKSENARNTPDLPTQVGGSLNPPWVAWLMGWPIGWTDLKPLEMDKCPSAQQSPFSYWLETMTEMLDAFKQSLL